MPLRVLFVTTTYPLRRGDAVPAFVADLARTLAQTQDIEVTVLAPHHAGAATSESVDGVHIQRFQYTVDPANQCLAYGSGIPDNLRNLPAAKWQLPGFFMAMGLAIHRELPRIDLIHAHWVEPAFIASLANLMHRKPLVISVHSLKPKVSRLHRHTLGIADRVLFNSDYTRRQAVEKGYACRGQVIHQGYDSSLFGTLPRTGNFRAKLAIPMDVPMVCAVGRMIEVKGLHILAAAAQTFLVSHPTAHLVIAGDGPERAKIESFSSGSVRSRIHFPGAIAREEIAELLADADLFINPGIIDRNGRAEAFGITTIEAMACGLPVIASRVGGIPETILDGVTGCLIPPADVARLAAAIENLLDDATLRKQMGTAGRQVAREKFSWNALAAKVRAAYDELMS
jgi:phosphatidylinositol alpha-1,6-mannosyltransferase